MEIQRLLLLATSHENFYEHEILGSRQHIIKTPAPCCLYVKVAVVGRWCGKEEWAKI